MAELLSVILEMGSGGQAAITILDGVSRYHISLEAYCQGCHVRENFDLHEWYLSFVIYVRFCLLHLHGRNRDGKGLFVVFLWFCLFHLDSNNRERQFVLKHTTKKNYCFTKTIQIECETTYVVAFAKNGRLQWLSKKELSGITDAVESKTKKV